MDVYKLYVIYRERDMYEPGVNAFILRKVLSLKLNRFGKAKSISEIICTADGQSLILFVPFYFCFTSRN